MKTWMYALLAAVIFQSAPSYGAVPKQTETVRTALGLPMLERVSALRRQGPQGYQALTEIMFDDKETMELRWKAVTAAARLGGKNAQPEVERALKDNDWFMRNAGLVAMRGIDNKEALKWAKKLLEDKALVVRVAAVETIGEIGTRTEAAVLWQKLNAKESFKKGQSLFIRQRIVEALSRIEGEGKEAAFVQLLNDKDPTLYPAAIQALERLTRKTFSGEGDMRAQRAHWINWWNAKG